MPLKAKGMNDLVALRILSLKRVYSLIWKDTFTPMFTAAPLTTAKTWKQPKCPSTGKWIKKMWYIYTMEYYSANKKEWNNAIYSNIDGPRDDHTKWSKPKTNIRWYHSYVESTVWHKWTYLQNRKRLTDMENKLNGYQRGKWWRGVNQGVWAQQTRGLCVKQPTKACILE